MSDPETKRFTGVVRGRMIELSEDPGLPDGARVVVEIQAVSPPELSAEDRAVLEHVYQERGCGVERDC